VLPFRKLCWSRRWCSRCLLHVGCGSWGGPRFCYHRCRQGSSHWRPWPIRLSSLASCSSADWFRSCHRGGATRLWSPCSSSCAKSWIGKFRPGLSCAAGRASAAYVTRSICSSHGHCIPTNPMFRGWLSTPLRCHLRCPRFAYWWLCCRGQCGVFC